MSANPHAPVHTEEQDKNNVDLHAKTSKELAIPVIITTTIITIVIIDTIKLAIITIISIICKGRVQATMQTSLSSNALKATTAERR